MTVAIAIARAKRSIYSSPGLKRSREILAKHAPDDARHFVRDGCVARQSLLIMEPHDVG